MIIEFMGCTGAGKTTLALGVARRLRAGGRDVRDHCSLDSSGWVSLNNALRTPLMLLPMALDWSTRRASLRAGWQAMRDRSQSGFWKAARYWAMTRRVGEDALRRRAGCQVVHVVDEGLMGIIGLAFCGPAPPSQADLDPLLAALPLPDLMVWVDAPLDSVVERTRGRPDPPRELRGLSRQQLRACLANVETVYRALAGGPRAAGRVIRAWNPAGPWVKRGREMDRIAEALRTRLDGCP